MFIALHEWRLLKRKVVFTGSLRSDESNNLLMLRKIFESHFTLLVPSTATSLLLNYAYTFVNFISTWTWTMLLTRRCRRLWIMANSINNILDEWESTENVKKMNASCNVKVEQEEEESNSSAALTARGKVGMVGEVEKIHFHSLYVSRLRFFFFFD